MPVLHWVYGVNWSTICNSGHLDGDRTVRLIGSLSIHDCILGGRSPQFLVQLGVEQDYAIYYSCMVRNTIMLLPYYQYFTATSKYNDYIYIVILYTIHRSLGAFFWMPCAWNLWGDRTDHLNALDGCLFGGSFGWEALFTVGIVKMRKKLIDMF